MQLLLNIHSRRVAISVTVVGGWTSRRDIFPSGRLSKLPDISETDAALRRARWLLGKHASRRGWTSVVGNEVNDLAPAGILANVICRNDRCAPVFFGRYTGTVNARTKAASVHPVNPGIDVGFLFGQHASALLLIEKDDGVSGKPL